MIRRARSHFAAAAISREEGLVSQLGENREPSRRLNFRRGENAKFLTRQSSYLKRRIVFHAVGRRGRI